MRDQCLNTYLHTRPHTRVRALLALISLSVYSVAQPIAADVVMEEVLVIGERPSLTNDPTALSRARWATVAGSISVLGPEDYDRAVNLSIADAIGRAPGVIAQPFFGANDQPRIMMRGSGLQQIPTQRGVLMLQDGLPLNRADGSYIVAALEPTASNTIEVYRGGAGARMGASTLGGALNFISLTGADSTATRLAVEGGSFGTRTARLSTGLQQQGFDLRGTVVSTRRDGFRDYNASGRDSVLLNAGYKLSERWEVRAYLDHVDLEFQIPGPTTEESVHRDPRAVHTGPQVIPNPGGQPPFRVLEPGPNVPRDRPRRDAQKTRFSLRTTYVGESSEIDLGLTAAHTDEAIRTPVSNGERSTRGEDFALHLRYEKLPERPDARPAVALHVGYIEGAHDRDYRHNTGGAVGALFAQHHLQARTLSATALFNRELASDWWLTAGLQYVWASRDNDDRYPLPTRPTLRLGGPPPGPLPPAVPAVDTGFARDYDSVNPSVGLAYHLAPRAVVFLNYSRSFETPTFEDLLVPVGGTPNSGPLALETAALRGQTADTLELGWRGEREGLRWEAIVYQSWLKDELLELRDPTGSPLGTRNAGDTVHRGLELGLNAQLSARVDASLSYTWQEMRFDGDPVFADNRLGAAPEHVLNARVTAELWPGLTVEPTLFWQPERTPIDNANTRFQSDYYLLGLQLRYRTPRGMELYLDARNLLDETYAAAVQVSDVAHPTQTAFLPGDGRGVYAGFSIRF